MNSWRRVLAISTCSVQTQGKAAAAALDGTKLVMPHFVYEGPKAELDLGNRKVELHASGTAHTRGDQVVFLPQERILFAGDLIEERMFPIFPWFHPEDVDIDSPAGGPPWKACRPSIRN